MLRLHYAEQFLEALEFLRPGIAPKVNLRAAGVGVRPRAVLIECGVTLELCRHQLL